MTFCIILSHICYLEEFGSGAILFCKGADSAMLDPEVCTSLIDDTDKEVGRESEWEVAKMLGIQSHLGEFASEGLRTLVLGVRFLTDAQCGVHPPVVASTATATPWSKPKETSHVQLVKATVRLDPNGL